MEVYREWYEEFLGQKDPYPVIQVVDSGIYGEYAVEVLENDGYRKVYMHHDLEKCILKAEYIFSLIESN